MTPTPSLKDVIANYLGNQEDLRLLHGAKCEECMARASTVVDLVISRVLDLPEMQNDSDPLDMKRETSRKNAFRAQLTSAIKGLKG